MPLPNLSNERLIFRSCGVYYLGQWFLLDRDFVEQFRREGVTADSLARLFKAYGVIRNFPASSPQRFEPLAKELNSYRGRILDSAQAPVVVEEVVQLMKGPAGKNCVSAASKACWMIMQHPVAIYDNRARVGLERANMIRGKSGYRYADYFEAWHKYRNNVAELLNETAEWLPIVGVEKNLESDFPPRTESIKQLANQPWFLDRIVDMRLFMEGNGNKPEMAWMSSYLLAAKLG